MDLVQIIIPVRIIIKITLSMTKAESANKMKVNVNGGKIMVLTVKEVTNNIMDLNTNLLLMLVVVNKEGKIIGSWIRYKTRMVAIMAMKGVG